MTIKYWQVYCDEELRENYFKGGHRLAFRINPHLDFVVQEPSAQDIIDAVVEEQRDIKLWKVELDERGED